MNNIIVISVSIIVSLIVYYYLTNTTTFNDTDEYENGYLSAEYSIKQGQDPQYLYDLCWDNTLSSDSWDKGWLQSCLDNGAKNNIWRD